MKLRFLGNNIIYLCLSTLLLLVSFVITSTPIKSEETKTVLKKRDKVTSSLFPLLNENSSIPVVSAQGVIAVDLNSAVVMYEKNADLPLLPASTTKIMTALVSMDYFDPAQVIKVGNIKVIGQKMKLVPGERITIDNLLYGLLVYSANDAAEVLADSYPGGRSAFVEAMNTKAKELYLNNTMFSNPTGLDEPDHVSTARDMVRLSEVAMRNPQFANYVATKEITVKSVEGNFVHILKNINQLLGQVEGVVGVKTGWTEEARENLVTYVVRDNKKILIAALGSQDRFGETKELIEWLFKNYTWQDVAYY